MSYVSRRYAPLNHAHIPGFPNHMPQIDWLSSLPELRNEEGYDAALHLIRFHMHVHKLKVSFHEDCLMKMFMASLEGRSWSWYEGLPHASIHSLKVFHATFYEEYKESYPSLSLVSNCCDHFKVFIQDLEDSYGDDMFMDEEILKALQDKPFHHQI